MGLPQGRRQPSPPGGVEVAEPAVAIPLRLPGPVSCHSSSRVTPGRRSSAWYGSIPAAAAGSWTGVKGGLNSRPSRATSSSSGGPGQVMPTTAARRRYSATVQRLTPIAAAIWCPLWPQTYLRRSTSRTCRIGSLWAARPRPPHGSGKSLPSVERLPADRSSSPRSGLAGLPRNHRLACVGIRLFPHFVWFVSASMRPIRTRWRAGESWRGRT